jgi:hypothetical protein
MSAVCRLAAASRRPDPVDRSSLWPSTYASIVGRVMYLLDGRRLF